MRILEFTTSAGMKDEVLFNTLLSMERKRSERTGAEFFLWLSNSTALPVPI
jgi:hypothetical protein